MPDSVPNSAQLHKVVELSSGIKDDLEDGEANVRSDAEIATRTSSKNVLKPVQRLKEALSSKEAFQKHYLVRNYSLYRSMAHTFILCVFFPRNCQNLQSAHSNTLVVLDPPALLASIWQSFTSFWARYVRVRGLY